MLITVIADHPARREPDLCELQRADSVRSNAAAKLPPPLAHDPVGATNLAQPLVRGFQIAACACGDVHRICHCRDLRPARPGPVSVRRTDFSVDCKPDASRVL